MINVYSKLNSRALAFGFILFLLGLVELNAQVINVNPTGNSSSTLTLEELIDQELIDSECAVANVLSSATGLSNGGGTRSFGYFTFAGQENIFPIGEGIILSTGLVNEQSSAGPNSSDFNTSGNTWQGDADIQAILDNRLGGNIQTNDATSVVFEFVPQSNTISFNYIFASEEWQSGPGGSNECNGSIVQDGFAFLIKGPGVVPDPEFVGQPNEWKNIATFTDLNGIEQPVSVGTIYNNVVCNPNPRNPDLYESYAFAGSQIANGAPIEYNARTTLLTARSSVQPGETYTIKLVIADRADNALDSAVFIEAGSFTGLGGRLPDFTVASLNPGCGDTPVILDTGITDPNATFKWYKLPNNINPIPGATGSTYTVESTGTFGGDGTYSVTIDFGGINCQTSDDAEVQFVTQPIIETPPEDLLICETDGDGIEVFDLTVNSTLALGSQSDVQVEYFRDNGALINDPANYINSANPETITLRVTNKSITSGVGTCPIEDTFILNVLAEVIANDVVFDLCDNNLDGDDTNGFVEFDLSTITPTVIGVQDPTQFTISYHDSLNDADLGQNPLPNNYTNSTINTELIYTRVENNANTGCYSTSEVTLVVNALPVITSSVDLRQCDIDTDGISSFNLTEANSLISSNFSNEIFTYYTSFSDANDGLNPIANPLNYLNTDPSSNPDVLFVRVETSGGCYRIAQLQLFVATTQIPAGFTIQPFESCDDTHVDDNITDGITTFDFSSATPLIESIFPTGQNITVTYYESEGDALAEINAIPDITNHINTASPFNQTITFRVDNNTDNSCQGLGQFELLTINPRPRTDTESVDIILCDDITVGDLSEVFDLTQNETFIFDGATNLTATYFLSYNDALNNTISNQINLPSAYSNSNPNETVFVRVEDIATGCIAVVDFDITVEPIPEIIPVTSIEACENNTDFIFDFNLGEKRDEILNGGDPLIFDVTFHLNQNDADNLINPQGDLFINTMNPQEVFFAITNTTTGCSNSLGSFFVEVLEGAQANSDGEPLDFELCDDNIENDGVAQFDFSLIQDEVLDGQDPNDYTITYHFSETDAINNQDQLPNLYENLTNPQIVWLRVSNNLSPEVCFEVQPVPLIVNPIPVFDLEDSYILCLSSNLEAVVDVPLLIDTGLSDQNFSFEWFLNGSSIQGESSSSLQPLQGGIYEVVVTDISTSMVTMCTFSDSTEVVESELPDTFNVEVTTEAFTGNNMIVATALGNSVYEFSLDFGPWQLDNEFSNVDGGEHIVLVRDVNGCGIISRQITVIDYPKFFTPNGDGNNDTWNIEGIASQPSAKIYIFDRYGKLLKQINPTSTGWDGTYRGSRMPSSDYWFRLEYVEPITNEMRTFSSHFSLKR